MRGGDPGALGRLSAEGLIFFRCMDHRDAGRKLAFADHVGGDEPAYQDGIDEEQGQQQIEHALCDPVVYAQVGGLLRRLGRGVFRRFRRFLTKLAVIVFFVTFFLLIRCYAEIKE